jgi:hypothetical protein
MKLISVLVPGLVTIATLSLSATPTIAFSVTQTSDRAGLQARLFGDTTSINITQFNFNQAFPSAYGRFDGGDFLGLMQSQGLVLSTGQVNGLAGVNCADGVNAYRQDLQVCRDRLDRAKPIPNADLNVDFSTDPNPPPGFANAPRDQIFLDIVFQSENSGRLSFDYVFGSEEYPEFVPSDRSAPSDIFYALLYGSPDQQKFDLKPSFQQATSVASAFNAKAPKFNRNLIGDSYSLTTPLDAYTKPIQTVIPFKSGINHLILGIDDVNDDAYDSAVFLQQISVQTDKPPSVPTPSLLFGLTWMGWRRWRDRRKAR